MIFKKLTLGTQPVISPRTGGVREEARTARADTDNDATQRADDMQRQKLTSI